MKLKTTIDPKKGIIIVKLSEEDEILLKKIRLPGQRIRFDGFNSSKSEVELIFAIEDAASVIRFRLNVVDPDEDKLFSLLGAVSIHGGIVFIGRRNEPHSTVLNFTICFCGFCGKPIIMGEECNHFHACEECMLTKPEVSATDKYLWGLLKDVKGKKRASL